MRRGPLLLLLLVSACAAPATSVKPPVAAPVRPVSPPPPPVSPPAPAPAPAIPPPTTLTPADPFAASFAAWRAGFVERAVAKGFDRSFVEEQLATVTLNNSVLSSDTRQPEFSKPISDYVRTAASPVRAAEGLRRRNAEARLPEIEAHYGVPSEILVAIWADESGFGKVQGGYDVISAFATLAYEGRRRDWAETQLLAAFTIIRDKHIPRAQLKGSWAGAMGQTQFIPEAYLRLGQDADGDGKVDIWRSDADALATAANHLAQDGWKRGESWAVEVIPPPGFDYSISESETRSPMWWQAQGVRRADGRAWSAADQASQAMLLVPAGANGPAFLAFPNHFVIRKYNNSIAYALSIGLLADEMRGEPALVRPWPQEQPLSREQRIDAQTALARLGYPVGKIDGLIGAGARAAVRQWQKASGLVADGYLTPALVDRLRGAAAAVATQPLPQS